MSGAQPVGRMGHIGDTHKSLHLSPPHHHGSRGRTLFSHSCRALDFPFPGRYFLQSSFFTYLLVFRLPRHPFLPPLSQVRIYVFISTLIQPLSKLLKGCDFTLGLDPPQGEGGGPEACGLDGARPRTNSKSRNLEVGSKVAQGRSHFLHPLPEALLPGCQS